MPGILRRNIGLIVAVAVAVVGVTVWRMAVRAPEYRAGVTLRVLDGDSAPEPGSRTVLGAAVDRAGLRLFSDASGAPAGFVEDARIGLSAERTASEQLDFRADRIVYGPEGRGSAGYGDTIALSAARFVVPARPAEGSTMLRVVPRDVAIDWLEARLEWDRRPSAGEIDVRMTASDPRVALRGASAVAVAYREASGEAASRRAESERQTLGEELRAADSLVAVTEAGLEALRSQARRRQLEVGLGDYERFLAGVLQADERGRLADPPTADPLRGGLVDPAVRSFHSRWVTYWTQREAMLADPALGPNHPDVQRLSTLIASTERGLVGAARGRMGSLRARIQALGPPGSPVSSPVSPADTLQLNRDLEDLRRRAAGLADRVEVPRATDDPAPVPTVAIEGLSGSTRLSSSSRLEIPLALVFGLLLGSAAALARERLGGRRRVAVQPRDRDAPRVEPRPEPVPEPVPASVPTLAAIPVVTPSLVAPLSGGDFRPGPGQSAGIAAYGELKSGLFDRAWGLKTLVVTSAHPGEGKTTTSSNLAAICSRQGLKVVLIECDLRRPSLGRYFDISRQTDLVDVLFEGHDWRLALQFTETPGLYVLLGEKSFPRAGDSLGGPEMKRLLSEITAEYDLVILDTSPLLVSEDAVALASIADGVLLVVRASRTDPATADEVIDKLRRAGATILGKVLNDPDSGR